MKTFLAALFGGLATLAVTLAFPASAQDQTGSLTTVPPLPSRLELRARPEGTTRHADIDITLSEDGKPRVGTITMYTKGADGCRLLGTPIVAQKKGDGWEMTTHPTNNLECQITFDIRLDGKGKWGGTYQGTSRKGSVEQR